MSKIKIEKKYEYIVSVQERGEWKPQYRMDDMFSAIMRIFELLTKHQAVLIEKISGVGNER